MQHQRQTWGFQSTSPVRGTTYTIHGHRADRLISIHVPREGDDAKDVAVFCERLYFNPRPP